MQRSIRILSTAGAAIVASAIFVPAAQAAPASAQGSASIRVCVYDLRGDDADVSLGGRYVTLGGGECAIFSGLSGGRTYRVNAVGSCGLDDTKYVRAESGSRRSVSFYGDCSSRSYSDRSYYYERPYRGYRNRGYNHGGYNHGGYNHGGYNHGGGNNGGPGIVNQPPTV